MNYYNQNQNMIENLLRQKDKIENMINQYSQPPAPVQNIINTNSTLEFEAKELKNGEDVSNILVQRRTLFIDEANSKIYIKELDGKISKEYEIIVPIDEKDMKIQDLEDKIKILEEKINEYAKPVKSNNVEQKSNADDNELFESTTKNFFKSVSKQNK